MLTSCLRPWAGRGSTVSLNAALESDEVRVGYKLIDGNVGKDGKR